MAEVAIGGIIAFEALIWGTDDRGLNEPGAFLTRPFCKWTQGPDCCAAEPEKFSQSETEK